ncbi:MAG: hypothetical protein H0V34_12280, partial [Gammaproteobacteria bacterium]|nr:hypothetical protein [Gammaproteobacteria bacterium]
MPLPDDVSRVRSRLRGYDRDGYLPFLEKLASDDRECIRMWKALERRKVGDDDLWVTSFLGAVQHAANYPDYHYLSPRKQKNLTKKIMKAADRLISVLDENGLDCHVIYLDGKNFSGFYVAEEFNDPDGARHYAKKEVLASVLIRHLVERAEQEITSTTAPRATGNVRAIMFARALAERHEWQYHTPLLAVIATATNRLFDTSYEQGDIHKLIEP